VRPIGRPLLPPRRVRDQSYPQQASETTAKIPVEPPIFRGELRSSTNDPSRRWRDRPIRSRRFHRERLLQQNYEKYARNNAGETNEPYVDLVATRRTLA